MLEMKNFRKILNIIMVLVLLVPFSLILTACGDKSYNVSTVAELTEVLKNVESGAKIVLQSDLDVSSPIIIDKKITLDLNGNIIRNTKDIWSDDNRDWSLISVRASIDKNNNVISKGELTIEGNGSLLAKENDCYAVDIRDGSSCIIKSGTFVGNVDVIYNFEGTLTVEGGKYSIQQLNNVAGKEYAFVLNCYDQNRKDGKASIVVRGGEFDSFNPANCVAEGPNTNFVAEGYTVVQTGKIYKVVRA